MGKITRKSFDFHGLTVERALKDMEHILYKHYKAVGITLEFIVGNGAIKKAALEFLKARQIDHYVPMANSGMIVVNL